MAIAVGMLVSLTWEPGTACCGFALDGGPGYVMVADNQGQKNASSASADNAMPPGQIKFLDKLKEIHDQAEKKNPGKADIHLSMAIIYQEMKLYKEAEKEYRDALARDAKIISAHYNLAIIYSELAEHDKAEAEYKVALSLDPDNEPALYDLGVLYLERKKYLPSEQRFKKIPWIKLSV